jgi:bifunctional non-homologous end joining protein LigD
MKPAWRQTVGAVLVDPPCRPARPGKPLPLPSLHRAGHPCGQPPAGDEWVHEIKLDGYCTAGRLGAGKVRMLTRSGLDRTVRFPSIAAVRTMP